MSKNVARKAAFARRKAAHARGVDGAVQSTLVAALEQHRGKALAGYMPIRSEVNPLPVMAGWDGPVCVPVIQGKDLPLVFHRWSPGCAMKPGPFGAQVPEVEDSIVPEVLIVPLLAFDEDGYRLGYGGGYYDRTLAQLRGRRTIFAVGLAYSDQQADALPRDDTDERLDAIATEDGLLSFR